MKGWKFEGYRHSLAAKGVSTSRGKANFQAKEFFETAERREMLQQLAKRKEAEFLASLTPEQKVAYLESLKSPISTKQKFFVEGQWDPEREKLHQEISYPYSFFGDQALSDSPKAVFTSGLPGSGKSSAVSTIFTPVTEHMVADKSGTLYIVVDPDQIKQKLPEFEGGIGAPKVHDESSFLKEEIFDELSENRSNMIVDTTMRRYGATLKMINEMKRKGYDVGLMYVEVPPEVAMDRAQERFFKTGRVTPHSLIADSAVVSPNIVESLRPKFDRFIKFSNSPELKVEEKQGNWVAKQ